ncbi:xanthine dehydrogenase/oxidase-like [Ylistrum balloti]|uniref:xanthine dehydrogenase/oxidase-like n=1 Tax=Ylistrum balloti TaxID=509963 RepID=UPI00290587E9|nr:xanthine dehydrogenase/oxidase-like [Ylistrum balloti]
MDSTDLLVFFVNGKKVRILEPDPELTLLQYLRRSLYLTGTKLACGQGACGACTVMVSYLNITTKKIRNISVNACLIPLCYLHGMAVTTVEGVGSTRNGLHPVQESLVESHGLQCGFCTPGMVMTMYTLFRNNPNPTQQQMERALEGNLCRCTGYRPIVDAFRSAKENCPCGLGLCLEESDRTETRDQDEKSNDEPKSATTQDVIFPPELQLNSAYHTKFMTFKSSKYTWYRPTTVEEALRLLTNFPKAQFVLGCNTIGYLLRKGAMTSNVIICCTHLPELQCVQFTSSEIRIGAGVTMGQLESELLAVKSNKTISAMLDVLRWVAADQIKNTATLGGHVMSKIPNLDMQTFFMAAGAVLEFRKMNGGVQEVPMDNDFVHSAKNNVYQDQILVSIRVPLLSDDEHMSGLKQPNRRGFDYGVVTTGLYVQFEKGTTVVQNMRLAFGGTDDKPVLATRAVNVAIKRSWNEDMLEKVNDALMIELQSTAYTNIPFRTTLACSFFLKFFMKIKAELETGCSEFPAGLSHIPTSGIQVYDIPDESDTKAVWKPIPNVTSGYIAAGEAQFVDDIPSATNELFAGLVTSTHAHAKILSVDVSAALEMEGVIDYIDYKDIPCDNNYGFLVPDNVLLCQDEVSYHGQAICVILAESREIANRAVKLVEVKYEPLEATISIQDAIMKEQFFGHAYKVERGCMEEAEKEADFVLEGVCETGAQEHLYMEPHSSLVIPRKEQNELDIITSTQGVTQLQEDVAKFLGLDSNRISSRVKRVGGGFGGKATDSIVTSGIAAIGAWKTNRPVRCIYDRELDFKITGKRHPIEAKYKVYFKKDGRIVGCDVKYYYNAGYSTDLSPLIMKCGMLLVQGCYTFTNMKAEGKLCRTNLPSNTAFRGFGSPQVMFVAEAMIQKVAFHLNIQAEQVRDTNMLRKGDVTPFNMPINDDNLYRCWEECKQDSEFDKRVKNIHAFNSANRWRKRGISIVPCMYGIGYPPLFLNQAGALVLVYKDGSVLLAHSGVELGQGLHTKMIQIAASTLEIPHEKIIISETSTTTAPNTSETGGSNAADLNAGAVLEACKKIKDRLAPIKEKNPEGGWNAWVTAAYFSRVSLSATGFYGPREEGYDYEKNSGSHSHYFTYGSACTEVEIDVLTGEHQVVRVDIVMDVGKSLNPAIDVGQIEGGFVQGVGMMTTEELKVNAKGELTSTGPLDYKVPGIRNIPRQMNVKLLKYAEGPKTVYSAKGIGEPPLLLAVSVFYAIKEAILAARKHENLSEDYFFQCPATVERIRMACQDKITQKSK